MPQPQQQQQPQEQTVNYEVSLSPEQAEWVAGVAAILNLPSAETLQEFIRSEIDLCIARKRRYEFEMEQAARRGREGASGEQPQ